MKLSDRYRPNRLLELVGQREVVTILSAWLAQPTAKAWCFVGGPGCGKTTAAVCLARELAQGGYPTMS